MKGISIAMETIVYVILAVMVLSVLLFFFTSLGGDSQRRVQMEQQRLQACGQYTMYDVKCESIDKFPTNIHNRNDVLKSIGEACKFLQYDQCNAETATIECIKNCCMNCPGQ
jgi:hypothetical protein